MAALVLDECPQWEHRGAPMRGASSVTSPRIGVAKRARPLCAEPVEASMRGGAQPVRFSESVFAAAGQPGASVTSATAGFVNSTRRMTAAVDKETSGLPEPFHRRNLGWVTSNRGESKGPVLPVASCQVTAPAETCSCLGRGSPRVQQTRE